MKIEPSFVSHWKTRILISKCGHAAALGLLSLWGHHKIKREYSGLKLNPTRLAAIMDYTGDKEKLWEAMTDPDAPWLDAEEGGTWELHGFAEHQKQIILLWNRGKARSNGKFTKTAPSSGSSSGSSTSSSTSSSSVLGEYRANTGTSTGANTGANTGKNRSLDGEEPSFSEEQVVEAGRRASIDADICLAYFNDRTGAGWRDKAGRQVKSMPHDLANFARHWKSNNNPKDFSAGTPAKAEGVWQLEKRVAAAKKQISDIQGNPDNKVAVDPETPWDRRMKPEKARELKELKSTISQLTTKLATA